MKSEQLQTGKEYSMNAVEVISKEKTAKDKEIETVLKDLGIDAVVTVSDVYYLEGEIDEAVINLLTDHVTQVSSTENSGKKGSWIIEVRYNNKNSNLFINSPLIKEG